MSGQSYDLSFKLLLVGCSGAGKSSILSRFAEDVFEEEQGTTIGVDFKVKHVREGARDIKLMVWDTAGQEKFKTLTASYYRGAHGVIFVYDVTDKSSMQQLTSWMEEVNAHKSFPDVVKVMVGNKVDLLATRPREVPEAEARAFAEANGMLWIEASAKTAEGINQAFHEMVLKLLENGALVEAAANQKPSKYAVPLGDQQNKKKGGGLCC